MRHLVTRDDWPGVPPDVTSAAVAFEAQGRAIAPPWWRIVASLYPS
ncbi:hypothetical protein HD597_005276 [Nonomuraea thailandensis]|uniref:Uncharacterized protein n=1 Tax=Nonomuraea thailandensis TaxID=1188745 RepID=A0A9X2K625_9ACTN|nr:hypothetical protein [Nonomuraea thailandensis]MCP2358256.1 hypothetical protein [Nonomuraea thailandensis]